MQDDRIDLYSELERLMRREPFVPFSLVTTGSTRYRVESPDQLMFGSGLCMIVPKTGVVYVPVHHIAAVELDEPFGQTIAAEQL